MLAGMSGRPVSHTQRIAASPDAVWEVIAAPGSLADTHPFCAANPVDRWPGPGSVDRVEYHNGRVITRTFTGWQEGAGFDIDVTDAGGPVAQVGWRLASDGSGSALTIEITPRMLSGVPGAVRPILGRALVAPMLRRYLRAVLGGIEYRVTTGRPVERNQFGAHPWFSPR